MQPGDFVQFGLPNGSTGQIQSANHYGGFYVKWVYGRDNQGEVVTALSSCRPDELMIVTRDQYLRVRDRKFNE